MVLGIKLTFTFGLLIFFLLPITLVLFFIKRLMKSRLDKMIVDKRSNIDLDEVKSVYIGSKIVFGISIILLLIFTLISSVWFVPVRNVGIVNSFNAPTGRTTGAGMQFTWPWQEVVDFDASVQTSNHTGRDGCTTVRIGSLATACIENRIQWQIVDEAAPRLYRDYKGDFENLRNNYVETMVQNALNAVFATYNPLSQVNLTTGQVTFDGAKLGTDVEAELKKTIGQDIRILRVSVPLVHHDAKTEENIKAFQDVIAKARILEQQTKNAEQEKALADLNKQFLTDEYIKNKCVDESVKMGVPPGLCLVGGGAIVNATK